MNYPSEAGSMSLVPRARIAAHFILHLRIVFTALALCVSMPAPAQGTYAIQVDSGWNLLSLPAGVSNGDRATLFPSAASPAFAFHNPTGYEELDTVHNGVGFWLKFGSAQTVVIPGSVVLTDTVEVQRGWNIIGAPSLLVSVDSIQTQPPGILIGQVFEFVPGSGHRTADTLFPGHGYWVKASQEGSVVLASPAGLPCPDMPTVTYGGRTYNTVQIGSQCWLKENLDIGTMILGSEEQNDNDTIEKYCYDDSPANCTTYGGLYQWTEAMQYDTMQGTRGICPPGWHFPTHQELYDLRTTVGGDGNALKAIGQGTGGGAGANTSGYSALLGSYRDFDGSFNGLGYYALFWSSTEFSAGYERLLILYDDNSTIHQDYDSEDCGISIRCLKD